MTFITSHGFIKGDTHRVCEDYTLSATIEGWPIIIVSDGCSSAKDTDVGARLIAHSTSLAIGGEISYMAKFKSPPPTTEKLGRYILNTTLNAAETIGIDNESCAATLLIGFVLDDLCHIYTYGDGVWFKRDQNGVLEINEIESNNQPDYLLYGQKRPIIGSHWSFPLSEVSEFGIATDGVRAVKGQTTNAVIARLSGGNTDYLIDEFYENAARRPYLYDDIGIASILCLDD